MAELGKSIGNLGTSLGGILPGVGQPQTSQSTQQTQGQTQQGTSGQQSTGGTLPGVNPFKDIQDSNKIQLGNDVKTNVTLPGIVTKKAPTATISQASTETARRGYQRAKNQGNIEDMRSINEQLHDEMLGNEYMQLFKQGVRQTWDTLKKRAYRFGAQKVEELAEHPYENTIGNMFPVFKPLIKKLDENRMANPEVKKTVDEGVNTMWNSYYRYENKINNNFAEWVDKNMNKILSKEYQDSGGLWESIKSGDSDNIKYGLMESFSSSALPMLPGIIAGFVTKNPTVTATIAFASTAPIEDQYAYEEAMKEGATKEEAEAIGKYAGIINGALETAGEFLQLKGMLKPLKKNITKEITKKTTRQIIFKGLKEWASGIFGEGLTEGTQELVTNALIKTVNEDKDIWENVMDSIVAGGALGAGGSTLGAGGVMIEEHEKNKMIDMKTDIEAMNYVMGQEERKNQRMSDEQKEKVKERIKNRRNASTWGEVEEIDNKFQKTEEENAGFSNRNEYSEGRNIGWEKDENLSTNSMYVSDTTISEDHSHSDMKSSDSFFETDENGEYIEYDDGSRKERIYAGGNKTNKNGSIKSQFTEKSKGTPRTPKLKKYYDNFYRLVKNLSNPNVKVNDYVQIGKTGKGKNIYLSKGVLAHIIEDHGVFDVNTLIESVNNPTGQKWESETTKTGQGQHGTRPYMEYDIGSEDSEIVVGIKPDSWEKDTDTAEYYGVVSMRESNAPTTPADDVKFQLKYEEEGYTPGVANKKEKSISGKEGIKQKNTINDETIEQLAEKYGVKVEVIKGMIEILKKLKNGKIIKDGEAYGKYRDQLLTLSEQIKESTAPHELLHAIFDMIDPETKTYLIAQVMKSEGWNAETAEERLADSFSNFFRTGKIEGAPKSTWGRIKIFFKRVRSFINGMNKWRNELEEIFTDIITADGIVDLQSKIDESSSLNKSKERMRKRFMEYRKNAIKTQERAESESKYQKAGDINSEAFKKRFGDSKVVDKDGNPLVVYHGTRYDIKIPNMKKGRRQAYGGGMYFTTNKQGAEHYANEKKNLLSFLRKPRVMEVYLSIQNPIKEGVYKWDNKWIDELKKLGYEVNEEYLSRKNVDIFDKYFHLRMLQDKKKAINFTEDFSKVTGYDGLVAPQSGGEEYWVAFKPSQVKSATDNVGTYDANNDDIRYQKADSDQKDNEGRTLSNGQAEYFKDSKVRDDNGNLLKVYHGTNSEYTVYDSSLLGAGSGDLGFFGDGWYFATHKGEAGYYGRNIMEGYLNITNPFYYGNMTKIGNKDFGSNAYVTIRNLGKIDESINNMEMNGYKVSEIGDMVDDYLKNVKLEKLNDEKDPYNGWEITYWKVTEYGKSEIKTAMKGLSENGMLDEQLNHYMMDKIGHLKPRDLIEEITDEARFDKTKKSFSQILQDKGYDGIVVGDNAYQADEIVAFRSNEFKNVDNLNPTDDEDIRYQRAGDTNSEAFKKRFDGSKVVKENGKPQIVYHGTTAEFTVFNKIASRGIFGDGYYFTNRIGTARNYGYGRDGRVMKVYLAIKNPYVADNGDGYFLNTEKLKEEGYDGVQAIMGSETYWVAFDSNQIKSATDNVGTYDPNNDDIRYQKAEEKRYRGQEEMGDEGRGIKHNKTAVTENAEGGVFVTPYKKDAVKYGDYVLEFKKLKENTVTIDEANKLQERASKKVEKDLKNQIETDYYIEQMAFGRLRGFAEYTKKPFVETGNPLGEKGEAVFFEDIAKKYNVKYQRVYHGSPADFERFDSSHMGEGEGAQAHGWGHYVAVDESTGRRYAQLHQGDLYSNIKYKGESTRDMTRRGIDREDVNQVAPSDIMTSIVDGISRGKYDESMKVSDIAKDIINQRIEVYSNSYEKSGDWIKNAETPEEKAEMQRRADRLRDLIKAYKDLDEKDFDRPQRNLYEVEIPDPVKADTPTGSNYLEEDGEIQYNQIEKLAEGLEKYDERGNWGKNAFLRGIVSDIEDISGGWDDKLDKYVTKGHMSGKKLYEHLVDYFGGRERGEKDASKFLESLGYDGIHYFGGRDGEAYVIFNDDALEIKNHERYQRAGDINSEAFKKRFGNSKVIDENGNPLVVYHGTADNFTIFDRKYDGKTTGNKGLYGNGFYFTDDIDTAKRYGMKRVDLPLSDYNDFIKREDARKEKANVMGVYLKMEKPFYWKSIKNANQVRKLMNLIHVRGLKWNDYLKEMRTIVDDEQAINFRKGLENAGYDGIIYEGDNYNEYAVFDPNQIKSATDNVGTYDPNNDDIRYQITEYDYDENGNRKWIKFGDNSEFDPNVFGTPTKEEQIEEDKENEKSNPFYNAWMKFNNQNYKDDQLTLGEFVDAVGAWGERKQEEFDKRKNDIAEVENDPKMLELQLKAVKLAEEETNVGKKFGKNVSKEVRDRQQAEVETKREDLAKEIFEWMYPGLKFEDATYDDTNSAWNKEAEWEMLGREKIEEKLRYFKKDGNGNWEKKNIKLETPQEQREKIEKSGNFDEVIAPSDRVIEWKTPEGQKGRLDKAKDPKQFKKVMEKINSGKSKTKVELKDVTNEVRALERYKENEKAEKERRKKEKQEEYAKKKQEEYKRNVRLKAFQRLVDMQRFEKFPFLSEDEIKQRWGFTDEEWKKITEQLDLGYPPKKRNEKAVSDFNKAVDSEVKFIIEGLSRQNKMKQKEAEKNLGEIGDIDLDVLLGKDEEKGQKEVEEFERIAKEEKGKSKKEKNKRLEQAREDVTQVEIDKERENSKSEKERVDKIIKSTKTDNTVWGSIKKTASDILTPVSTRIREISPKIYRELMKYFQNKDILTNQRLKEIDPFLKAMGKIRKENPVRFMDIWVALANRNIGYANGLLQEYGVKVPTKLLDTIFDEAEDVGLNINYLGSYYPLSVKAPKSFMEELLENGNGDIASEIEKKIQQESQKKGGPLDESEVTAIINSVIAGEEKGPDVNLGNKHLKKRNTEIERTPKMLEYCDDPISTLITYVEGMTDKIERAKFLGKSRSGNVHTLADYVYNVKNGLTAEQQDELMELLKSVFNDASPNKFYQTWRDIATLTTLGSPSSTLTQISDLSFSIYENGWKEALKAVWDIFMKRKAFDLQDMGVINRGEEYTNINSQKNLLQKAIHNVFKLTFFSKFDTFGKSTFIQSTWNKRRKRALKGENGDPQLIKDIMKITDDEYLTYKIIKDLRNGVFSEEVALVMYMKLGNVQPLTKAQMPKAYLDNPNGRLFYQFKTFGIKQLDYVLQETKEQTKGFRNLSTTEKFLRVAQIANMIFIMTLMGAGASELKDITMRRRSNSLILRWLFGEDVGTEQVWDKVEDSALQLFGLSRYTVMQMKSDPVDAITNLFTTFPATNLITYPFKDINKAFSEDGSINWRNPSSYQLIPVIGKYRYWIYGGGQDKQQEALDKEKKTTTSGGSSRSTRTTRKTNRNTRSTR